jgi:small subunit ribosomal protein S16
MLVIRLTRVGKKKDASFRVVVVDSKRKVKAGNYLEMVGSYDPRANSSTLKADRIKHWIGNGAKPSDTVHNLLISQKILSGKKINVLPKKVLAKAEEPAAEAGTPSEEVVTSTGPQKEAPAEAPAEEAKTEDNSAVQAEAKE